MLVAAMNPCPCGYAGSTLRECRCSVPNIQRYRSRISGPLLDRIDIHIDAPALTVQEMRSGRGGDSSETIRQRVKAARQKQLDRFSSTRTPCNARMSHNQIQKFCSLTKEQGDLLQQAMEQLNLSARAYDRILKVARTIADIESSPDIQDNNLLEAIQYRSLDRNLFY